MSDEKLTCPYDEDHVVNKLRMARHLVKCQANHPHIVLSTCYYDFLHRVPPEKLDEHLENCPSKKNFQSQFCLGEQPPAETYDPVKNIFLRCATSGKKGQKGPAHSLQSTPPFKDTSKGAIPKTTRHSGRGTAELKGGPSKESQMQQKAKGKDRGKKMKESWETESSDEGD